LSLLPLLLPPSDLLLVPPSDLEPVSAVPASDLVLELVLEPVEFEPLFDDDLPALPLLVEFSSPFAPASDEPPSSVDLLLPHAASALMSTA
jgi:hypothetical protein